MNIPILYEDKDVLVLNKPSGLMVHGDGRNTEKTLTDWVLLKYPEIEKVGETMKIDSRSKIQDSREKTKDKKDDQAKSIPESKIMNRESITIYRPGIVHRLDKETSGVIIIAKNQESFLSLKKQFKERKIVKNYRAFVYGKMAEDRGVIDRPIGRSKKDFRMWSAQRGARGEMREAVTLYKVISQNKDFTFVEVTPKTGRTHQIRVHFKAINHPVVCDKLYAPKKPFGLGLERLALHAFQIKFKDKVGKLIQVEAPYPDDFLEASRLLSNNLTGVDSEIKA